MEMVNERAEECELKRTCRGVPLLSSQMQRCPVLQVCDAGASPGQVQRPDDVLLPLHAGDVEAGLTVFL